MVERKWVKDSQHFLTERRDFRVVVEANSHQMHYSVARFTRDWESRAQDDYRVRIVRLLRGFGRLAASSSNSSRAPSH